MGEPGTLYLEKARAFDDSYQHDVEYYSEQIKQLQHLLSVRSPKDIHSQLLGTTIRIINRGKAEAFALNGSINFDIALLDLIQRFSDELSVAAVKNDLLHQMEFTLFYAASLNGDKRLPFLDVFNTVHTTDEQKQYLWKNKLRAESVIFENLLGFIIAHEMGHLVLAHDTVINEKFPQASSRQIQNPEWVGQRRQMELEADEFASRLCLGAIIQPVQLLPWFGLNEIRRRYYGISAEYPTSAQRIAIINKVYIEVMGKEKLKGNLTDFSPLPPHKDVVQVDYQLFLEEFRKVRKFSQAFLVQLDQMINELLKQHIPYRDIAQAIIFHIESQKDLLRGAKQPQIIGQLISLASITPKDISRMKKLVQEAGIGPNALATLEDELMATPINWDMILNSLHLLQGGRDQFLQGLTYNHLLSNTAFRWAPDLFRTFQEALPAEETRAKELKPYDLKIPLYNDRPTFLERLNGLRVWDGKYSDVP